MSQTSSRATWFASANRPRDGLANDYRERELGRGSIVRSAGGVEGRGAGLGVGNS
ncbi:hypothetical protein [Haladaptatus pallidirubidus]|uniref:hypothetical protein n=1 Tax=Haladaptatus pallidirubidus TaxID=1008152 RepID=UPI0036F1EEB9